MRWQNANASMKIYGELESLSLSDAELDEPPSSEGPDDGEDDSDDDEDCEDEDCDDVESEPAAELDDPDCLLCVPPAGGVPIGVSSRSGWPKSVPVPEPVWRQRVEFDDVEDDEDVDDSVFERRSARGGLELLPPLDDDEDVDDDDSDALRRSARGGSPLSLLLDDEDDEDG